MLKLARMSFYTGFEPCSVRVSGSEFGVYYVYYGIIQCVIVYYGRLSYIVEYYSTLQVAKTCEGPQHWHAHAAGQLGCRNSWYPAHTCSDSGVY